MREEADGQIGNIMKIVEKPGEYIKKLEEKVVDTQHTNQRLAMNIDNIYENMQEIKEDLEQENCALKNQVRPKEDIIRNLEISKVKEDYSIPTENSKN
jgi:hypothetical protein